MKTQEFKNANTLTSELLNRANVKEIKEQLMFIYTNKGRYNGLVDTNQIADTLLQLISNTSNDFTKDIASKCKENEFNPSEKQAWCLAYQIINNIEAYKLSMIDFNETCLQAISECVEESKKNEVSKDAPFCTKAQIGYTITRATRTGIEEVLTENGFKSREIIKRDGLDVLWFDRKEGAEKIKELRKQCRIPSIAKSIILNHA
jgi:hypothetical protein